MHERQKKTRRCWIVCYSDVSEDRYQLVRTRLTFGHSIPSGSHPGLEHLVEVNHLVVQIPDAFAAMLPKHIRIVGTRALAPGLETGIGLGDRLCYGVQRLSAICGIGAVGRQDGLAGTGRLSASFQFNLEVGNFGLASCFQPMASSNPSGVDDVVATSIKTPLSPQLGGVLYANRYSRDSAQGMFLLRRMATSGSNALESASDS